jgi:hypothetical protein
MDRLEKQETCEVSFESDDDDDDDDDDDAGTVPGIRNSAQPVTGVSNPALS